MRSLRRTGQGTLGHAGFTLLELAVVLFIIALVTLLVIPNVKSFTDARIKYAARKMAGRASYLYDQASAGKLVLRLTFNLDTNSYSVARLDPHSPEPAFVPDLDPGASPVALPPGVRIRDVTVADQGTVSRGTISCNFYPEGFVDPTVVHLVDSAGHVFTLSFEPLTGQVAIARGDLRPFQRRPS